MYDPKTKQIVMIDTCFAADHNHFDDTDAIIFGQNNAIGWLDTVAAWNPVTYLLEGLRSLTMEGWRWGELGQALLAIAVVATVSMSLCFGALRGRIKQA